MSLKAIAKRMHCFGKIRISAVDLTLKAKRCHFKQSRSNVGMFYIGAALFMVRVSFPL
ncbi:MAG: hypothetical protein IJ242_11285 [Clostridia bacterium]|nr:hypothetical protein [Clostridia bacterium]